MMYFDSRIVIGFMIVTVVMIAVSWWRHSVTRTLIWFGVFTLSLQNALAVKAANDMVKDYQASVADGSLHALSGFAALPEKVFSVPVTVAFVFFAAAAIWWLLDRIGVIGKLGIMLSRARGKASERKTQKAARAQNRASVATSA